MTTRRDYSTVQTSRRSPVSRAADRPARRPETSVLTEATMTVVAATWSAAAQLRSLHVICELTRLAACDYCSGAGPTQPCVSSSTGPDGVHIARFAAARRRGLITETDFAAAIAAAGVFTNATIVYDDVLGGTRSAQ